MDVYNTSMLMFLCFSLTKNVCVHKFKIGFLYLWLSFLVVVFLLCLLLLPKLLSCMFVFEADSCVHYYHYHICLFFRPIQEMKGSVHSGEKKQQ